MLNGVGWAVTRPVRCVVWGERSVAERGEKRGPGPGQPRERAKKIGVGVSNQEPVDLLVVVGDAGRERAVLNAGP